MRTIKKTVIVITLFTFIFASQYVYPKQKAEAAFQLLAAPAVLQLGAGAYVLGMLGVASVAGIVGYEYADEIKGHALNTWDKSSQVAKDMMSASLSAMNSLGSGALELNQDLKDYFKTTATALSSTAVTTSAQKQYEKTLTTTTVKKMPSESWFPQVEQEIQTKYPDATYITGSSDWTTDLVWTLPDHLAFVVWEDTVMRAGSSMTITIDNNNARTRAWVQNGIYPYSGSNHWVSEFNWKTGTSIYGVRNELAKSVEHALKWVTTGAVGTWGMSTITVVPRADLEKINGQIGNARQKVADVVATVGGAIPFPQVVPRTKPRVDTLETGEITVTNGEDLVWNPSTDTYTSPDGTVVGQPDITFEFPVPKTIETDTGVKVGVPSTTGEIVDPITGEVITTPTAPTTGDTGLLQGLWDWLKGILQAILDAITSLSSLVGLTALLDMITELLSWINPYSDVFFLKVALVPSPNYFKNYWNDIYNMYADKIPIVAQMITFFNGITNANYEEKIPQFAIDLPEELGGKKVSIIDFQYFADYQTLILNFIRFIAWFVFLKRMLRYMPKVVY